MKPLLIIISTLAIVLASAAVSLGGNLDEGIAAADAGDFKAARELWLIEAGQGNASAQNNLGVLYAKGQGVARNDREAAKWFLMAAQQGDSAAQTNLGIFYAKGQGVAQDDREAAKWFQKAAEQGDAAGQFNLGIMYDVGRGVTQNSVIAYAWYVLARKNGLKVAQNYLTALEKAMDPGTIEMGHQIAEQLRAEIGK